MMINTENRTIHDTFEISDDLTALHPSEFESNKIRSQLPMVWHRAKNFNVYDEGGNKGVSFYAFEEGGNLNTNIGYIMVIDTTDDETELDVTKDILDLLNQKIQKVELK